MKFNPTTLLPLAAYTTASELFTSEPSHIFSNPPSSSSSGHRIPTSYESAVLGRRILALTPLGNIATVFPSSSSSSDVDTLENRPPGLGGMPHALMEYVADCEGDGNPTFLAINIETSFKNVRDGSNVSLAQQWTPVFPPDKRIKSTSTPPTSTNNPLKRLLDWLTGGHGSDDDGEDDDEGDKEAVPYSAANLPRFSLLGYIEKIDTSSPSSPTSAELAKCFVSKHPDAKYWLPGNRIHEATWVRLVVQHVYWVGGFGDRAYIGWIPTEEWKNVTKGEWEDVRLPGEKKGWKEWSLESAGDL
ncbi:pyridoxamine 5'-phosphate oxidase-domain-containing protein [Xylariaceae sp. FL1272]|nr:pyridoxamine 5'-phosphate oxidase-domain-containing protein [Xylariaceae sp. FL1272]